MSTLKVAELSARIIIDTYERKVMEPKVMPKPYAVIGAIRYDYAPAIVDLMRQDKLLAAFIYQAVREFAESTAKFKPAEITKATNGMVKGRAWIYCAEQILAALPSGEQTAAAENETVEGAVS